MELKKYLQKQSLKTLKGLRAHYEEDIINLELEGYEAEKEREILESVKFEIMVRDLKRVTNKLNKIEF